MIFEPPAVAAALEVVLGASGCSQTAPPPNIAPSPSSAATRTAPSAESQATTPCGSVRSPGPAEAAGREVGEAIDDATVTAKVKAALLRAPDVKGLGVKVETDKAVIQLSGFFASQAHIDNGLEVAKGVRGVREVQNKMSVKPG